MVSILAFFWAFVLLFAIVGALRGWARELINTIALLWATTLIEVFERFFPLSVFPRQPGPAYFYTRTLILALMFFFGYHTPRFRQLEARTKRESARDMALGFIIGGLNGFILMSSLLFYLKNAGYPLSWILPPEIATGLSHPQPEARHRLIQLTKDLPTRVEAILSWSLPKRLGWPWIIIASLLAGVFLIVIFI